MAKKILRSNLLIYKNKDELRSRDRKLLKAAEKHLKNAYAPYSHFHVSSAILLANKKIIVGANQENASYPLCMCSERVAIASAASQYPDVVIKSLLVTAYSESNPLLKPVTPCGACRQVICEFESKQQSPIRLLLASQGPEIYEFETAQALLPLFFDGSFLATK